MQLLVRTILSSIAVLLTFQHMVRLSLRVGVEGFFCIVRSSTSFYIQPQWYFTSKELENYMKIACRKGWETNTVGTKVEAFAVAGCDVMSAYLAHLHIIR